MEKTPSSIKIGGQAQRLKVIGYPLAFIVEGINMKIIFKTEMGELEAEFLGKIKSGTKIRMEMKL